MATLTQFDVRGEQVNDDETEEVLKAGDPSRSLLRYQPDGRELFVHARINLPLWRAAVPLPVLLLKPQSPEKELMPGDGLLTPQGSGRNFELLERIAESVAAQEVPACYLAHQHGDSRRDFFFVTEDVAGLERIARTDAAVLGFPLAMEHHRLADLAPTILPYEAIGELGLDVPANLSVRTVNFDFWGAEESLAKLRSHLERRGYRFVSLQIYLRQLRMAKEVPIDGKGFRAVLKEIAPLSRSLGCSYLGTETIGGFEQFALTNPLPERYAADPSPVGGLLGRLFGRKGP